MSKITIFLSICAVFLVFCHGVPVCPDGGCPHNDSSSSSSSSTKQPLKKEFDGFLLLGGYFYDGDDDDDNDDDNILDNVEAYGSNLSLPSLPSLPLTLAGHIAEMTESGAIFVAGGYPKSPGIINDKIFMLSSLSSSKWEEVEARMPVPVFRPGSVVVGDIILVLGGYSRYNNNADVIQMLETNKSLPTWKLLNQSKLPFPLTWHSAAVFEGQVIIVTEHGVTFTTSVSSIISDTQIDWVRGYLPGVEGGDYVPGPSVEVVKGKLVVVWGSKVFTKSTMDSQWVQLEDLPDWKSNYPSIGLVRGNIVVAGGGYHTHKTSARVFMWVEASSEWEEVTSLKIPREKQATVQLPRGITIITQEPKLTTSTNRTASPNN